MPVAKPAYYLRACHPLGALMPTLMHAYLPHARTRLGAILLWPVHAYLPHARHTRLDITLVYLDQARHNTLLTSMPGIDRQTTYLAQSKSKGNLLIWPPCYAIGIS